MSSISTIIGIVKHETKYNLKSPVFWIISILLLFFLYTEISAYILYYPIGNENSLRKLISAGASSDFKIKKTDAELKGDLKNTLETLYQAPGANEKDKKVLEDVLKNIDTMEGTQINAALKGTMYSEVYSQVVKINPYRDATLAEANARINEAIKTSPFSSYFARRLADRMAVFLSFIILFVFAFIFDRDKKDNINEIIYTYPIKAHEYVLGKYLGTLIPYILQFTIFTTLISLLGYIKFSGLGWIFNIGDILWYFFIWVCISILFASALIIALSLLFRNGIAIIPVYLIYFIVMIRPQVMGDNAYYPIDLFHFIIRWDNFFNLETESIRMLVFQNRILYSVLAIGLVTIAIFAWKKFRSLNKGAVYSVFKRFSGRSSL